MGYIEQTDVGNVYVTDINDWFATLSNLNRECRNYTESEIRYKEILAEHDKQIRAEVIEEVRKLICDYLYSNNIYLIKIAKDEADTPIYPYKMADDIYEQLKEKK